MAIEVAAPRRYWNSLEVLEVAWGDFCSVEEDEQNGLWWGTESIWVNTDDEFEVADGEEEPEGDNTDVVEVVRRSGAEEECLCRHFNSVEHSSWLQS